MAEDSAVDRRKSIVETTPSNTRVQVTGSFGGQDTTGPNFNDPNALGPKSTVETTQSNPRVQATGSFGGQNTTGPNSNDPNALGSNFHDPNALGPNSNDPNALGPNSNDPNALGSNVNNPIARVLNFCKNLKHPKLLIGSALCCCICCTSFIVPAILYIIALSAGPPNNRIPAPGSVDFGPSRFDVYCNHTYNPQSARPTRQTVGNRSFVTNGFDVHLKSYQYVVFELCRADGVRQNTCTGSIIDSRHILTAAHCVTRPSRLGVGFEVSDFINTGAIVEIRMGVVIGRSKETADIQHMQVAWADGIYVHSNFDEISEGSTDVALIRLNRSLDFNDYIKPVCLAGPKDDRPSDCVVVGFGPTERDNNDKNKLFRAPNVSIYSADDCSIGKLAKVVSDQVYETSYSYMLRSYFDLAAKWFLPILFRGKLCSHTDKERRNVCSGDSGGPLLCTPKGVASNKEYHNPSSPLFRETDPTLKQFGINNKALLADGTTCGQDTSITIFMSVKDLRLWLEYVAWPALQDQEGTKKKELKQHLQCHYFNWELIKKAAEESDFSVDLTEKHLTHICRKFNSYMLCADNSPKLEYCDHLISNILNTIGEYTWYIDLLPSFKQERCLQRKNAVGCNVKDV